MNKINNKDSIRINLSEGSTLTYSQLYDIIKLLYANYDEWDAYKRGIIDKDGKILRKGQLEWIEILVRNIKEMILSHVLYRGVRGKQILDRNLYRFIDFLKECVSEYPDIGSNILTEQEIIKISITKKFNNIINKYRG